MTVYRWDCREKGCRVEQRFDPAILDGLLPRNSSRFLFIEHKPAGYTWEPGGQHLALKRLARLPGVTVWWIRDHPLGYETCDLGVLNDPLTLIAPDQLRRRVETWGKQSESPYSAAQQQPA